MVNQPTPKAAVALIRKAFTERQSEIKTKDAYNLLAQLWGHKDWATASAALSTKESAPAPKVYACSDSAVNEWPVWVFANQGGSEDEPLYVYPFGTRLEHMYASRQHWHLIDDRGLPAVEVPDDLTSEADQAILHTLFIGEEVACAYADSDEYGFPACANEREVHEFLKEELGWGYRATKEGRPLVEVTSHCRGDDGMVEWWVEARVHPRLNDKLLRATKPNALLFEKALNELQLQYFVTNATPAWAPAREVMVSFVKEWLVSADVWTLKEIRDLLKGYADKALLSNVFIDRDDVVLHPAKSTATAGDMATAYDNAWNQARQALAP